MFGRIRGFLCRRGLHWWEFVGWAEYGRGRLERCTRILSNGQRCPAARTLPIETRLLEQVLKTDLAKITARKPPPSVDQDQVRFEAELDEIIADVQADIRAEQGEYCPNCNRWRSPSAAYCIRCGSGRVKPEGPGSQ